MSNHKNRTKLKKISRTYRVSPMADGIVKLAASLVGISEVDVWEACVVDKLGDVVRQHLFVKHLLSTQKVPPELELALKEAKKQMIERWKHDITKHVMVCVILLHASCGTSLFASMA